MGLLDRFARAVEAVTVRVGQAAAADPSFARAWRSLQSFRERNASWRNLAAPR